MDRRRARGTTFSLSLMPTTAALARGAIHFRQDHLARSALHKSTADRVSIVANDEIALPAARHQAIFDLRRTLVDPNQTEYLLSSMLATTG